jgi:hypothetical protein
MPVTLITDATSALAYQFKNALNGEKVLLGDYHDLPEFMVKAGKMIRLPNPAEPSYAHQMLTLCLDNDIQTVYPLKSEEAEQLQPARQLFEEFNITLMFPDGI